MKRSTILAALLLVSAAVPGYFFFAGSEQFQNSRSKFNKPEQVAKAVPPPAITAIRVQSFEFIETVLVTGSLVPRDSIIVSPEVEGLRIVEVRAEEGDYVKAGDVLAVLENETLMAQIAQKDAALRRSDATIAQAKSQIAEAEARLRESQAALKRAKPLRKARYLAKSVMDQRRAAVETQVAQMASAKNGLAVAEASKTEIAAQKRELSWRLSRAKIKAPVDGLISKRNARIGEIAIGANAFSGDSPMFRIIANNEIELDAEVTEIDIAKIQAGQKAVVNVAGVGDVKGRVRLISPEVDKTTRLGRVRIFLGDEKRLKVGSFGRGVVETRRATGLGIPLSAVIYGPNGPSVLVIKDHQVHARSIKTGLISAGQLQVRAGVSDGDIVVAKAGTFLRDGDAVKAVLPEPKVSEAQR